MSELVKHTRYEVNPADAQRLARSRLVPEHIHKDPASVEYMMRIGAALGIDPTSAFQHIFVFKDKRGTLKAGMSAHLMAALARAAGHELHVSGDATEATAVLIRRTDEETLRRFQWMREEERRQKLALLEDRQRLYDLQRRQILDRVADLKELAALDEKPAEEEVAALRGQLAALHGQYDFDALRKKLDETAFDIGRMLRFKSTWTMKRAKSIEGLTDKGTWTDYGPEMLKRRSTVSVVRDGAIDVILGVRNFMANLGVMFSGSADDELAMANSIYLPEEVGAEVDASGAPLRGEVVDVTDPKTNPAYAKLLDDIRKVVAKYTDGVQLLAWVDTMLDRGDATPLQKTSLVEAVTQAVLDAGRAQENALRNGQENTLHDHLEAIRSELNTN